MNFSLKFSIMLSVVIFLIRLHFHWAMGGKESILIVALPQTNNEVSASWERGEEFLPGAVVASKSINNDSELNICLKLLVADSGHVTSSDYSYSGNVMEVVANLTLQNRFANIIGIAGVLHPIVLLALKSFKLPIASLIHFSGITYSPSMFYMTASTSVVTDSIVALMNNFNEDTIGLITESYHSYYLRVSNQLNKKARVSLYIQIGQQSNKHKLSEITTRISRASLKLIFLSASRSISLQILCEAYRKGLTWPKYAWILLSFHLDVEHHVADEECNVQRILEGVLILELAQAQSKVTYGPLFGANPFTYVLHDAIWVLALRAITDNHTLSSHLNDSLLSNALSSNIYVYQVFSGTLNPAGVYDGESRSLTNVSLKALSIDDHKHPAVLPLPYLMILPVLCGVFNTVLLALFFCFRNEPDVKSSSVSLSVMMFIGCYLFVAYTIIIIIGENFQLDLCMVRISDLSLCVPLVLATLLVKMLRVYHVFTLRGYEKPSIFWYNCALFLYTLLIIAPKVCIVILWSSIDLYHRKIIRFVDSSEFTVVKTQCRSEYTFIWMVLMAVYDIALSVAVVIVAVKTRKVRFARYKDTIKVNLLVFLVLFISISALSHWYIFTVSGLYILVPTYILYAGSVTLPFICQFTLFVPKIWTPLCNRLHYLMSKFLES